MVRVTEVLDYLTEPELVEWKLRHGKMKAERMSKAAMYIGSRVDSIVQKDIKGEAWELGSTDEQNHNEVVMCIAAWTAFKNDFVWFVPSVKGLQEELVCGEIVGHLDFHVVKDNGSWGVVDLKCARAIWPKNWVQVSQYGRMKGGTPDFVGILRLDKEDGGYEYKEVDDRGFIERKIASFDARYQLYREAMEDREFFRKKLEEESLI